jgi:polysaccharide pyruvyl transferase WcaK-like protein
MCCRPVVSIGYERKFDALMESMQLGAYCQHVERLDVELLKRQLMDVMQEQPVLGERLAGVNHAYREALEGQFCHVLGLEAAGDVDPS